VPPLAFASPPDQQARFNRGTEADFTRQDLAGELAAAFTGLVVTAALLFGCFASKLLLSQIGAPGLAAMVAGGFGIAAAVGFSLSVVPMLRCLPALGRL
jgi:hypothetical protein